MSAGLRSTADPHGKVDNEKKVKSVSITDMERQLDLGQQQAHTGKRNRRKKQKAKK